MLKRTLAEYAGILHRSVAVAYLDQRCNHSVPLVLVQLWNSVHRDDVQAVLLLVAAVWLVQLLVAVKLSLHTTHTLGLLAIAG
jgi:hypothetical protein